ncbi:hypothetical protein [Nonomuraea basaltis]|uniref:hypothetical protein n=1 Tax=Nonomuraea basaltis TaxID=2495887 RepID=UPI00110C69C9|nr:hypothetical protein [Nonomuraea basaltis]TMR93640.1 hypothetical protein EJK15_38380 [Nonomuraea basaltis]
MSVSGPRLYPPSGFWRYFFGRATRGVAKRLRRLGIRAVAPAESFYVTETQGPLVEGELERARQWGERLAATFPVPAS